MTYSFITGIGDDVIALGFFLTILTVLVVFCRSGSSRGVAVENSQVCIPTVFLEFGMFLGTGFTHIRIPLSVIS